MSWVLPISAAVGYVLGALPFGYWVARAHGIDIFQHGSKNPGATNVRRVLGKGPGNLVFALDAAKGALAAGWPWLARWWFPESGFGSSVVEAAVVSFVAAVVGHSFSCFTGFRGGKGVATSVGGFAVLLPWPLLVAAAVWALVFFTTRYVSLASLLAAVAMPVTAFLLHEPRLLTGIALLVALLIVVRHRANIVRLCRGTENKFVKKPPAPPVA